MTTHKILVPSNFMSNDDKTLNFVIQKYANDKNAHITLFHAYTPIPEIEMRNNPVMEKMLGNLSYQRQYLQQKEKELQKAKEKLIMGGFIDSQLDFIFTSLKRDVATDIIRLVREKNFNTVVMSRTPGKIARFFTRSISKRLSERLGSDVRVVVLN